VKSYEPAKIIFPQGEGRKYFCSFEKGHIQLSIFEKNGSEKIIAILENNTFAGEYAAFDGYPCFATATALEKSPPMSSTQAKLHLLLRAYPGVAFLLIATIIGKIRLFVLQVKDLSFSLPPCVVQVFRRYPICLCKTWE